MAFIFFVDTGTAGINEELYRFFWNCASCAADS
jgi:hypothetical protein